MAYIGQGIKEGTFAVLDTSGNTYNGSNTTFSLGTQVGSAAQLLVSHDGVIQKPGTDYTLASGGTQITFSTAPASGASIFIVEISGAVGGTVTPSDNSVGITQLNLSDGSNGQVLQTNGSGTISFATVDTSSATDSFSITGSTPTLTIGDAGAEDTKIVFDGNAQDYHIGLDDSTDKLVIGKGSTLGTTTSMSFDENGIVTKPLQPLFKVQQTGALTVADGHTVFSTNTTEAYDVNGDFSGGSFTAPVDGYYLFTATVLYQGLGSGDTDVVEDAFHSSNQIETTSRHAKLNNALNTGGYLQTDGSTILFMDANDTCKVVHEDGGTLAVHASARNTHFEGCLLQ